MMRYPWLFSRVRPARVEAGPADPAPVRQRGAFIKRFRRNDEGVAAVEFAFVAGPFLFLLFAIIEVAMVFFAGQVLETATSSASRLILTGQAQQQNFDQTAFKNEICRQTNVLMDCGGIGVDVRTYASFGAAGQSRPTDSSGAVNYGSMTYNSGAGGDIVVVRVVYQWPVLMPSFGMQVGDLPNGKRLLMATAAFRNEPF